MKLLLSLLSIISLANAQVCGDVDSDSYLTNGDVNQIRNTLVWAHTPQNWYEFVTACDVNDDGWCDIVDVVLLRKHFNEVEGPWLNDCINTIQCGEGVVYFPANDCDIEYRTMIDGEWVSPAFLFYNHECQRECYPEVLSLEARCNAGGDWVGIETDNPSGITEEDCVEIYE